MQKWHGHAHDFQPVEILLAHDVCQRRVGPIEADERQAVGDRQRLVWLVIADDRETGDRPFRPDLDPVAS